MIDLCEILKDCPEGTKLYSTVYGESKFRCIVDGPEPIVIESYSRLGVKSTCYTSDGRINQYSHGECVLFPSKNQRDWSKFKTKKPKFDPKTLKPFDSVLVRDSCDDTWRCRLFSYIIKYEKFPYRCFGNAFVYCIPYNDETKHLVGTSDEEPEFYKYQED